MEKNGYQAIENHRTYDKKKLYYIVLLIVFTLILFLVVFSKEEIFITNRTKPKLSWGIAGLGRIANDFALTLTENHHHLVSVAAGSSPDREHRAKLFAKRYSILNAYSEYMNLALDKDVDIVYIAATNNLHYNITLMMLEAGKHVLVEKPTSLNAKQTIQMINLARKKGVFFSTNFWTRQFPVFQKLKKIVRENKIGEIVNVRGDFGFQAIKDLSDPYFRRFYDVNLGGGCMLDMGVYLIQYATFFLNHHRSQDRNKFYENLPNISVSGVSVSGVDTSVSFILTWDALNENFTSKSGVFSVSIDRVSPFTIDIIGTHGIINIQAPANCPTKANIQVYVDALNEHSQSYNSIREMAPRPCCSQSIIETYKFTTEKLNNQRNYERFYPCTSGFIYAIEAIENCISKESNCSFMPDLTDEEQIYIMKINDEILLNV